MCKGVMVEGGGADPKCDVKFGFAHNIVIICRNVWSAILQRVLIMVNKIVAERTLSVCTFAVADRLSNLN